MVNIYVIGVNFFKLLPRRTAASPHSFDSLPLLPPCCKSEERRLGIDFIPITDYAVAETSHIAVTSASATR
jgi:hypothetical protein